MFGIVTVVNAEHALNALEGMLVPLLMLIVVICACKLLSLCLITRLAVLADAETVVSFEQLLNDWSIIVVTYSDKVISVNSVQP